RLAPTADGHPSAAAGCPAAHAADPRARQRTSPPAGCPARVAPSYLALLRVEFAAFHSDHRLAPAIGIVTVALVLVLRRTGVTRHPALRSSDFPHALHGVAPDVARSHPTASLTGPFYGRRFDAPFDDRPGISSSAGSPHHHRRAACGDPVDRLVAQRIRQLVLGPRAVLRRPSVEAAECPPGPP